MISSCGNSCTANFQKVRVSSAHVDPRFLDRAAQYYSNISDCKSCSSESWVEY